MALNGRWATALTALSAFGAFIVSTFNSIDGWFSRRALKKLAVETKSAVGEVKEHTDGMLKSMTDSAKKEGQIEGHKTGTEQATKVAEVKADALAEGQAQGRAEGRDPQNFRGPSE